MNLWVLIGMVLVVALLAMGKNPLREFQNQQKAMMEKYGSDELTATTNIYLEQRQNQSSSSLSSGFGLIPGQSAEKKPEASSPNDIKAAIKNSATVIGNDPSWRPRGVLVTPLSGDTGFDDILIPSQNPASAPANTGTARIQNIAPVPVQEPVNSYYPPIVDQSGNIPSVTSSKLTGNEPKLRSGQPVGYEGMSVYSLDAQGNKSPLPDGDYVLQDGSSFSVSNGRRIFK